MTDTRNNFGFARQEKESEDLKKLAASPAFALRPGLARNILADNIKAARQSADQIAAEMGFDSREKNTEVKGRRRRIKEKREPFSMMVRASDLARFRRLADQLEMSYPDAFSELLNRGAIHKDESP